MWTNPYMLAALAAVSLPWIIEWLFRRRRRVVELPTIRFLLRTAEQKKVRLQDLIILVVRSLAIFLLVLAIARPILRPDPVLAGGRKQLDVVMLFDATYSNAQKAGSDSAFALARKIGSEVTAALPKGTRVTLASLSDRVAVVMEASDDLPAVRERIEQLEVSDKTGLIADALAWAEEFIASRQLAPAEIYILSDMQDATWGKRPDGGTGVPPVDPKASFTRL
ncbi:MAG: VWA domain-containing protein, partial [Planctomycetes bacterium]|nr:VWA domain-containing protein [Planctomycetota bacterium]